MKRHNNETILQEHFCNYLNAEGILFNASMAGVYLGIPAAIRRKKMGAKKGFPDIAIFEIAGKYHGLFIEIKVNSAITSEQKNWCEELNKRGYKAVIMPKGMEFQEAFLWLKKCVNEYLSTNQSYEEDKNRDLKDFHPRHPDDR